VRTIAGAALLIGALAFGPAHAHDGWGVLVGVMIGLGLLLVVAEWFAE
jgi:hypothetical protein